MAEWGRINPPDQEEALLSHLAMKKRFSALPGRERLSQGAEITPRGMKETFSQVVEIEARLASNQVVFGDVLTMYLLTDRALNWFDRKRYDVTSGEADNWRDEEQIARIRKELEETTDLESRKKLMVSWYLSDPQLGANKALQVLENLVRRNEGGKLPRER